MGLFNKENQINEKPKNNKTKTIKVKSLNGYDAIREKIDEGNTLNVKQPLQESTKPKTKISIGL